MTPADIDRIARHVALQLFAMGARDLAAANALAREFAASPAVHRSLASMLKNDGAVQQTEAAEAQQHLEWSHA